MADAAIRRLAWLLCLACAPLGSAAADEADAGLAIYFEGRSGTGGDVAARVSGDIPLSGKAAACVNCHRASGLGTSEGRARSLPITANALFSERSTPAERPAYDDLTLLRAVTLGVSANGRQLDPLMPRYRLDQIDGAALLSYLHRLGRGNAPGVTEDEIVLATVVSDLAPNAQREAVTQVLERFVEIKNRGSRQEARRAAMARRHPYGERHDRGWRRWRLITWELQGSPATWADQLRTRYAADPPFLLLSGTLGEHWREVHRFCEEQRLPCVLPQTSAPPDADADFYSVYFNSGVRLDGAVIARHVARMVGVDSGRMLVVHDASELSRAALDALRTSWADSGGRTDLIEERTLGSDRRGAREWGRMLQEVQPRILVALVDQMHLAGLDAALRSYRAPLTIYTSETFTQWSAADALLSQPQLWHVHPFSLAQGARPAFAREAEWLRVQKLQHLDPLAASQALFACHVAGEQLAALTVNFSREYFVEGLEHMLDGTNMTSLVPRTTLGPGQRFISRGAYVVPASALVRGDAAAAAWVEE